MKKNGEKNPSDNNKPSDVGDLAKSSQNNISKTKPEIEESILFISNALRTNCEDIENWELLDHLDLLDITSHNYLEKFKEYKIRILEGVPVFLEHLKEFEKTANKLNATLKKKEGAATAAGRMNLSDFSHPITPNPNSKRNQGTKTVTYNTSSKLAQTDKQNYKTKNRKPELKIEEKKNKGFDKNNRWKKKGKKKKHWYL